MIRVLMKSGRVWKFSNIAGAYVCRQRKYLYRLFLGDGGKYKPVWIGRWCPKNASWYTIECEIGAVHPDGCIHLQIEEPQ